MTDNDIQHFRRSLRAFEQLLGLQAADCCRDVSLAQCHAILEVEAAGDTTNGQLAERLYLDKSTLSRTVDSLVSEGFVERLTDSGDRRVQRLRLTGKGRSTCEDINCANNAYFRGVFDEIPAEKHQAVIEAVQLMVGALRKRSDGGGCCK